jgi:hypothetical protein
MVIKVDNNMAHSKLNPCVTPARIQRVMVPGPIKAAVINAAGPTETLIEYFFRKISNLAHPTFSI